MECNFFRVIFLTPADGGGRRRRRRAAAAFPDSMFSTIYRGVTVIFHSQTLYVLESQYVELIFYGAGFLGTVFVLLYHTVKVAGVFRSYSGDGGVHYLSSTYR